VELIEGVAMVEWIYELARDVLFKGRPDGDGETDRQEVGVGVDDHSRDTLRHAAAPGGPALAWPVGAH
jgi:hypothetical protein